MKNRDLTAKTLEDALRRSVPHIGCANAARVARACGRVAGQPKENRHKLCHAFGRAALRMAACLLLVGGVLVVMKTLVSFPQAGTPHIIPVPQLSDFATWESPSVVTGILSNESANLVSDIATLTTVLNERSLSILF